MSIIYLLSSELSYLNAYQKFTYLKSLDDLFKKAVYLSLAYKCNTCPTQTKLYADS